MFPLNRLEKGLYDIQQMDHDEIIKDMKYLTDKPIESLSAYPFYRRNIELHNSTVRNILIKNVSQHKKELYDDSKVYKHQFEDIKSAWLAYCKYMDQKSSNVKPMDPMTPLPPQVPREGSSGSGRRGRTHGDSVRSEAEFLEILANFERETARDPSVRSKLTSAHVPDLIYDPIIRDEVRYIDTNNFIEDKSIPYQRLIKDNINDFTPEEHEAFCEAYLQYPKQFGKIAKLMGGKRSFNDCVLHYYQTKKDVDYKTLLANKNRRTTRKGRRKAQKEKAKAAEAANNQSTVSSSAPASVPSTAQVSPVLPPNNGIKLKELTSVEEAMSINDQLTSELESDAKSPLPLKRKPSDDKNLAIEPSNDTRKRTKSGKGSRGRREKRKSEELENEDQTLNATPEPKLPGSNEAEIESANIEPLDKRIEEEQKPTTEEAQAEPIPKVEPQTAVELQTLAPTQQQQPQVPATAPTTGRAQKSYDHKERASSYWSVSDLTLFQKLLLSYGTNWKEIAKHFKSKSVVMVKNCYTKHCDKKGWKKIATEANDRIRNGLPVPIPPQILDEDPQRRRPRGTSENVADKRTSKAENPVAQLVLPQPTTSEEHKNASSSTTAAGYLSSIPQQPSAASAELALMSALDKKRQQAQPQYSPGDARQQLAQRHFIFPVNYSSASASPPLAPTQSTSSYVNKQEQALSQESEQASVQQQQKPSTDYTSSKKSESGPISSIQQLLLATNETEKLPYSSLPPISDDKSKSTSTNSSYSFSSTNLPAPSSFEPKTQHGFYLPKPNLSGFSQRPLPSITPSSSKPLYDSHTSRLPEENHTSTATSSVSRSSPQSYSAAPVASNLSNISSGMPSLASLSEVAAISSYSSTYTSKQPTSTNQAPSMSQSNSYSTPTSTHHASSISDILNPVQSTTKTGSNSLPSLSNNQESTPSRSQWFDPVRQSSPSNFTSNYGQTYLPMPQSLPSLGSSSNASVPSRSSHTNATSTAGYSSIRSTTDSLTDTSSSYGKSSTSGSAPLSNILYNHTSSSSNTDTGNTRSSGYLPMPSILSGVSNESSIRSGSPAPIESRSSAYSSAANSPVVSSSSAPPLTNLFSSHYRAPDQAVDQLESATRTPNVTGLSAILSSSPRGPSSGRRYAYDYVSRESNERGMSHFPPPNMPYQMQQQQQHSPQSSQNYPHNYQQNQQNQNHQHDNNSQKH